MPHADPEVAAAYRAQWEKRNPGWRRRYADGHHRENPVSRLQVLDQDVAQQRELMKLEARHIGHRRAEELLKQWIAAERRWIRVTFRTPAEADHG